MLGGGNLERRQIGCNVSALEASAGKESSKEILRKGWRRNEADVSGIWNTTVEIGD